MVDKQIIKEWIDQANEDFNFASVSLDDQDRFYSRICFLFQQSAEKYLKAFIVANELGLRKIHNLRVLLDICKKKDKEFEILRKECVFLNAFYIDTRYPAVWPVGQTRKEAEKAKAAASRIGNFVNKKLRIES